MCGFRGGDAQRLKLANVELTAISGLTITIPREKNNAGGFKDLNNSGRVIDIPPDNKRKLTPVSDIINYISKRPQGFKCEFFFLCWSSKLSK